MEKPTAQDCTHALCCADFIRQFKKACSQAGGGSWASMRTKTLEEVMHLLAPNGIRVSFEDPAHESLVAPIGEMMAAAFSYLPGAPIEVESEAPIEDADILF